MKLTEYTLHWPCDYIWGQEADLMTEEVASNVEVNGAFKHGKNERILLKVWALCQTLKVFPSKTAS